MASSGYGSIVQHRKLARSQALPVCYEFRRHIVSYSFFRFVSRAMFHGLSIWSVQGFWSVRPWLANQCFFDSAAQSDNSQPQILFRFLRLLSGLLGPVAQPLSGGGCLANGQMSNKWGGLDSGCNHRPVRVWSPNDWFLSRLAGNVKGLAYSRISKPPNLF